MSKQQNEDKQPQKPQSVAAMMNKALASTKQTVSNYNEAILGPSGKKDKSRD